MGRFWILFLLFSIYITGRRIEDTEHHRLQERNMTSSAELRVSSLFNFSNHVVLVTGGATGLGEMAAQGFVQNGAKVFIASRKESELKRRLIDSTSSVLAPASTSSPI